MKGMFAIPLALAAAAAPAQDWPHWGGPSRNFQAASGRLASSWPSAGPREVWSRSLGEGYSAIAVEGNVLYTMYRPAKGVIAALMSKLTGPATDPEVVIALDAASGRTLWEHAYDAPAVTGMNLEYGPGPHSTPLVAGDLVYTVGLTGKMHALDKKTGRVAWSHDLWGELKGPVQDRGYACSPLIYKDTVIVTVGGPGQSLVAFDRRSGSIAWKNQSFGISPSSPLLIDVDGQPQLVLFHADGVAGLDPGSGALYWSHPHSTSWGLNISLPVWGDGNLLFCSSAYNAGSRVLQLSQAGGKTTVKELWFSNRMRLHIGNAVRLGDVVYGSSGDFGPAFFTAAEIRTGRELWRERSLARASFVYGDGKFVILDEDGNLALATPTPTGLTIHAKAEVLSNKAWTVPTLVGTRLYLRDRAVIKALELG